MIFVLVALTLLAIAISGVVSYALQRNATQARIDQELIRGVEEVRILAQEGVMPETGEPFVESEDLVYVAMQRHWPGQHESMLGLDAAGIAVYPHSSVPLRLEDDPQLVAALQQEASPGAFLEDVEIRTIATDITTYRAVLIPVHFAQDAEPSLLVFAIDYGETLRELDGIFLTYALTGLGVALVIALLGSIIIGRQLAPLRALQSTAAEISDADLERRVPVTSADDIAELSLTFNEMLDRIQAAFRSQRQLLDDVGHELRTPITIVQGNLELLNPRDPAEVEQVREISLDELERVNRLIEDLMTLAKAERPDFVSPAPLDLETFTAEVADKAARLGDREWSVAESARIVHDLDSQRITQAWLQLAGNAVKYSEPGSPISLGSRVVPGLEPTLELWVRDAGIGIAEGDRDRIFERFGRGGNATRAEGTGLGLNIVVEIVRAHGGSVGVDSEPGSGSTFTMSFPLGARGRAAPAATRGAT